MLDYFSSYLKNFLLVALCAFICETAAAINDKGKTLSKALSLICALCIFISATFPLLNLIKLLPKKFEQSGNAVNNEFSYDYEEFTFLTKEHLEEKTIDDIYVNTGILIQSIDIQLLIENDNFVISGIIICSNNLTDKEKCEVHERLKNAFGEEISISFAE